MPCDKIASSAIGNKFDQNNEKFRGSICVAHAEDESTQFYFETLWYDFGNIYSRWCSSISLSKLLNT